MKLVIQCASSKSPRAGTFRVADKRVAFVAKPHLAIRKEGEVCFHPDDQTPEAEGSWRDVVLHNNTLADNPDRLLPAADLYSHPIYRDLRLHAGPHNLFILSAGWGLVKSDYRLPTYDITFSSRAHSSKIRGPNDTFRDFNHLRDDLIDPGEEIHFFGGADYIPLYCQLARSIPGRKVIYYVSSRVSPQPGFIFIRYPGSGTNWHYRCARDFIQGKLKETRSNS